MFGQPQPICLGINETLEEVDVSKFFEIFNRSLFQPSLSLLPHPCHLLFIKQIICLRYLTNISDIAGKDHFATAMTVAEWILIGVQFLPTLIPVRNTISRS